jgi:hypothetical protein
MNEAIKNVRHASGMRQVSIPFSSGQWMKHTNPPAEFFTICCFNPLFIGSMNEAQRIVSGSNIRQCVSIPFSSGQWMKQGRRKLGMADRQIVSIPFSSGQWMKQIRTIWRQCWQDSSFNPLFIGSMNEALKRPIFRCLIWKFQSPFHRVNEWSGFGEPPRVDVYLCFNPLFIGSMNEAWRKYTANIARSSFNPLFIGSMNEACCNSVRRRTYCHVSIPFSSGQWMKRGIILEAITVEAKVSIPFSSGQWMKHIGTSNPTRVMVAVSIPFSSGQWMKHEWRRQSQAVQGQFQSPFHRVNEWSSFTTR